MRAWYALPMVVALLTGCASIVDGTNQSVSIKTMSKGVDIAGAQCTLTNSKGTWYVTTPGSVTIHRSYGDLNVNCVDDGYTPNIIKVGSATKGLAFGNILAGGLIGGAVDMSTGAAYDYPSPIIVNLQPANNTAVMSAVPGS